MNEPVIHEPEFLDLVDLYLDRNIDAAGLDRLEHFLQDAAARGYFVRYAALNTEIHLAARARRVSDRSLRLIAQQVGTARPQALGSPARSYWLSARMIGLIAACVLVAVTLTLFLKRPAARGQSIAWLANAQNCQWAQGAPQLGDLQAGKVMPLDAGLVEIRFAAGATAVIEGPARFVLLSDNSARLLSGKLSAHVPPSAHGFTVELPNGRVVDLGTEFGVSIRPDGQADVHVFAGRVQAFSGDHSAATDLVQSQSALITDDHVIPLAGDTPRFVRAIGSQPRTKLLDFHGETGDSRLHDRDGLGTGLNWRLPGTGSQLSSSDVNLRLDTSRKLLNVTTTRSDINTQYGMDQGEYLGTRLSELGFTGSEDFEISVTVPDIPPLEPVGQFGLYAGLRSDRNIRGGLISTLEQDHYRAFLVNNDGGRDSDLNLIGLLSTGSDLRLTLRRIAGQYSMTVENQTLGNAKTLAIPHLDSLDREKDLYVGLFAANTQSDVSTTLKIQEIKVTVWTVANK